MVDVQWANFGVNLALAIITLLAVLVALFSRTFWKWWNRPKIKFGLRDGKPHIITQIETPLQHLKYFRIRVKNYGRTTAKNCYIKLLSVTKIDSETNLIESDKLKWSSAPTDSRYSIPRETANIFPSGGWEFCDLFMLDSTRLVEIYFATLGGNRKVPITQEYFITIEIVGDNIKPKRAKIKTILPSKNFWNTQIDWVQ